jgi:hypothetical protein
MDKKTVYQYDNAGYYLGETEAFGGLMPHNCTATAPELQTDFVPRWTGAVWEQVEDHKGKEGYLNGQAHTIKDYGPLPEGWSDTPPPPTEAELAAQRKAEILAALAEIDIASIRPLRAVADGSADEYDTQKLADLEDAAAELRAGLAEVSNG